MTTPQVLMIVWFFIVVIGATANTIKNDSGELLYAIINIAIVAGLLWWGGFWT